MMQPNMAETFFQEADDLLGEIETAALTLTDDPSNMEVVNHLFRAVHTIKGSGSMFGFEQVAAFTHHIETLLDQVREGLVPVNDQLATLVLAAADQIKLLLAAAQGGPAVNPGLQSLLLESVLQVTRPTQSPVSSQLPAASTLDALPVWDIVFRPEPALLAHGGNPFLLFRDLKTLGKCVIKGHIDSLPILSELDPEACYLWWTIQLVGACTESDVHDVFMFEDGGELSIAPGDVASPNRPTPEIRGAGQSGR
jgi:two-component system chemotaxis sensor kinase CheA